jgi:hypothetical protein
MSEYFGPFQDRVLNTNQRNIENIIFQYKRPPLSSEWNLINQISNEKIQNLSKSIYPSGWLYINDTLEDVSEEDAPVGSVLCSKDYISNSIKLISKNNNIAIVNGWVLLIQGTNNDLQNNLIILNSPTGQIYDFVFLEVWKKLIGPEDPLYPYGNVLTNPYSDNEIQWDFIGIETTKRIQIQYRIRSVRITSSIIDATKEIFDLVDIHPIGGRTEGEAHLQKFVKYGPSDPGLYIAGDGSENSKNYLNTTDGYVYAIPMFIINRRINSDNLFSSTRINENYTTKDMFSIGYRSDRADEKLLDVIYKSDIVDLRHKINNTDLDIIINKTINKLISGELTTSLKKGFDIEGSFSNACSGGSELLKVERLNSPSGDNIPDIGIGSNISSSSFKRRVFCNSRIIQDHNIIEIPNTGVWEEGTFSISSKITLPEGKIISVDGFYSPDQKLVSGVSSDGINITISNSGGFPIVGTTNRLFMEFTFEYYSSALGFKDIPKKFIEINKNDSVIIATKDKAISLRYNNNNELLNFGASSGEEGYKGDINENDYIEYKGITYTDLFNSGCLLVLNRTTNLYGKVTINLLNNKYNKYYILGVKAVEVDGTYVSFSSERVVNTVPEYNIESYIITVSSHPNKDIKIYFYIGSKFLKDVYDTYSLEESIKFFELSKQGRGIIDTFELIEVIAIEDPIGSGRYLIDTKDKPIIKLATISVTSGDYIESFPFAYKYDNTDTHILLINSISINRKYPIIKSSQYEEDTLPTQMIIEGPSGLEKLRVPVFVHSYVASSEGIYNFFYNTIPYQGLLNTTSDNIYGQILKEDKAIITTLGSGEIKNFTYNEGTINIQNGTRLILGNDTLFTKYVQKGDYIRIQDSYKFYRIEKVDSDTQLILTEIYLENTQLNSSYEIIRTDIPITNISNVIDRLPTYKINSTNRITEYKCYSDNLTEYDKGLILTQPKMILQDPLNATTNTFILGNDIVDRGRSNLEFIDDTFKLITKKPYLIYEKTIDLPEGHKKRIYQFYLFERSGKDYFSDNSLTGKLYLMVLTSEGDNNTIDIFSDNIIDIYELIGRPIIKR